MRAEPALLVFSHLRWKFVYQRPQHLLARLAAKRRVLFVEEPIASKAAMSWEKENPHPNVTVCRPCTGLSSPGFHDEQMPPLHELVRGLVEEEQLDEYVVWFYTPMALPLLEVLHPKAVVYDCMDELSAFLHAPPLLLKREAELLEMADVVFTGGPSLYAAKKDRHANIHCFPSSVDPQHFGQARSGLPDAQDQVNLPFPRLGYFGVIDERFDVPLLEALATAHTDWQICLVGPVVKIDPATLPQRPNIHYFGQRDYADLPSYLSGWDVCLLPFARNESTRFISPTKTLEYMAAEKPIVSTPITDVAVPYGEIVYLGDSHEAFIAACEQALASSAEERDARAQRMREVLGRTSWDATVEKMEQLIVQALRRNINTAKGSLTERPVGTNGGGFNGVSRRLVGWAKALPPEIPVSGANGSQGGANHPVVVIGAGPTGLSAAYHLGEDAVLIERGGQVGGWCRSIYEKGFTFDYAGHIMFSKDPYVHELYQMLLGDNVHWQDREAWIFSKDVYTRYPFQGALYGLAPDVIKECIVGAIEARYGPLRATKASALQLPAVKASCHEANGNGVHRNGNGVAHPKGSIADCCADGIMESTARLSQAPSATEEVGEPKNFEEFIYKVWGAGIAKHFAVPYNKKLWAVPLDEMETSWLGGRVPLPDLEEMIEGALRPVPKPMGPNARFGYPLRGGFQALMDGFIPHLRGPVLLDTAVQQVSPSRHRVTLADGKELRYERLISTMPLPALIRSMGDEVPAEVHEATAGLRHVSVRCVHLGIGRESLTEKHWIYYPEETVFHRIFVQGNASPHCNPPGGFGLTCEITYSPHKPLPCDGDALTQRCIEDCHKVGIFKPEDPVWATVQCDLPHAYVVYDHARSKNVATIRNWLAKHDIILAGRYSEWEYYNSDHAFLAGQKAANQAKQSLSAQAESTLILV